MRIESVCSLSCWEAACHGTFFQDSVILELGLLTARSLDMSLSENVVYGCVRQVD